MNNKINPIELMLELYGIIGENYQGLTVKKISTWGNDADITLDSSCTGQEIKISVSVEDRPEAENE